MICDITRDGGTDLFLKEFSEAGGNVVIKGFPNRLQKLSFLVILLND